MKDAPNPDWNADLNELAASEVEETGGLLRSMLERVVASLQSGMSARAEWDEAQPQRQEEVVTETPAGQYPIKEPADGTQLCTACGTDLPADARFCRSCGQPVPRQPERCPGCGSEVRSGARFCAGCGSTLTGR